MRIRYPLIATTSVFVLVAALHVGSVNASGHGVTAATRVHDHRDERG
jgi:hypothetical protein